MNLLEREAYLRRLGERLEEARRGEGALVFVGGEAGVGKTSLVRRSAAQAREVRVAVDARPPHDARGTSSTITGILPRHRRHRSASVARSAMKCAAFAMRVVSGRKRPATSPSWTR